MNIKTLSLACACFGVLALPARADMVANWDFNEGTGTTVTDSVSSLTAELQGEASWTTGRDGSAVQFVQDDTSQVYVGTPGALNITGAVTVAAWVHPDGKSHYGIIAGIDMSGGTANDQYVLKTTASATSYLSFQVTSTSATGVTATDTVSIDERAAADADGWLHVAAVFAPGESVTLYVNGTRVAQTATSVTQMQSKISEEVPFRIGNMTTSSGYGFNGAIDSVSVYDSALDATAIADLANTPVSGDEGEYLFSFGAVADPQYKDAATAGSRYYRNTLDKLPVMVTDFNGRDLEFVICLGDFIDDNFDSYTTMMNIWDDLTAPAYQVVGNHDLSIGSHTLAEVIEVMNIPSNYYSFTYQGWRFLVLDGNDAGYGIHSDEQLAWARDALDQALADGEPVIIFDHYPIYPPGTAHISPQASELVAMTKDYPNVRAWLNGHNHAGAYGESGGIHYLNMEGMVETADTTAYAEIQVWSDRLEVLGEGREPDRTLLFPATSAMTLTVPAGLAASDGGSGINLSWSTYSDTNATGLELQRRVSGENSGYETVATLTPSDTGWVDENAASGVTYLYRLRAVNTDGDASDWSALTNFELGFLSGQLTDLAATGGEDNEIALTWALDGSYDSLVLERSMGDSGEFSLVTDTLDGSATSYMDTGLAPNTSYTYRVAGVVSQRQTQWSQTASATSGNVPPLTGEAAGLIAYWSFDEGTGPQAADYTGNGSDGTLLANAAWTTGKFNGAVSFSGDSEDQVFVGTPDLLNITGAVTVMAWVKPNGVSNYGVIAGIDQSGGATYDQFVLKTTISSSFQLTFQVTANGSGTNATDSVSLTTRSSETSDGWVHVAGVFIPGESVNLYVNGELVASTPVSIETLQSTLSVDRPFRIGNMSSSSNYGFNGAIDELRVFAASVSPADIATYAAGEAIPDPVGTIIEQGATWAYLDDGSDQGSAWTATDFNDSSWSTGAAQLGYGDGDEVTTLGYGGNSSNKYPTAYFRKSFELTEAQLATIDELKFSIIRDDGVVVYINGTEVVRDNLPESGLDYQTYALSAVDGDNEDTFFEYSVSPDALVAGTNVIAVEIHQQRASSSDISFDLILDALTADDVAAQDEVVVTTGTTWKYLDDGSDQGSAWTAPAFDDSTWSSGPSQLGYGDGDEATVLSYGNDSSNKHITYYFRTSFEVADASDYAGMIFEVLRDDGVIVYLNGHEIIRDNMPATGVDYQTFSSEIVSGDDESTFFEFPVAASYLMDGTNVIAAEIHNRDGTSSDLGFDLKVTLQAIPDPNAPVFSDDTIVGTSAVAMGTYAFSLADYVTDADGDELVFSKVSGPDWLTVNPDGTLSGTPATGDIGENSFVISVTDNDEGTSTVVLEITVGEAGELARAPLPGSDEALVFGVIPDTQGGTNGTPPDEAAAIAQRFIGHAPAFIIHVGDVTDGNSSNGDTKLSQLEDLKDLLVNPLAEHGIGFYPVRGNHDSNAYANTSSGVSAWAAAFPYLFEGEGAVIDPTDVPGGSPSSPNTSNFCYVFDAGHDTFFVSVDQWNGGSSENYSNWVAAKFAEIRAEHPDAHIFGYSHSGLYAMASHPAMSEFVTGGADPYIAAGKQYQIDGWFSGHNHIYDRSMAVNLSDDNKPYMFDFTCGSASEKFYSLSRTPAEDQHLNRLVDSNTVTGRPIAYLLARVNGPFVSVETYMSPDTTGAGTFNEWSVWDAYTYSRNGLQFTVAAGQNYNERNITDTAPEEDGYVGTTVSLIDGVNSDTTTFTVGSTSFSPYRNITTGWWTRDQWYDAGSRQIVSDIVSIHGMRNVSDRNRSDIYTLVMSYDAATMSDLQQQHLSIVAFLDENTADADEGEWIDAVQATLGTAASEPFMRAPSAADELGAWGIDVENGVVWARLDYQGDFAIASNVPDTDTDGLADAWEMDHFGNLDQNAEGDPDGDGLTNIQEQAAGTSPLLSDTDGDLFGDAVEVQYGLDPVSPESELSGSVLEYLRQHPGMQHSHGLYTRDSLGALTGQTLMEVDSNGDLQLQIQLWESTDLENWSPVGSAHGHTLPMESGAPHFYQWGMGGTQD